MLRLIRDIFLASAILIYATVEGTTDTALIVCMLYMIYTDQRIDKYNKGK